MASHQRRSPTPALLHTSALTTRLEAQRLKSINHRLFYIAKIHPESSDLEAIPGHYERLFHRLLRFHLGESVSGLLLLYPRCIIHIIESSSEILYGVIQDLLTIQSQGERPLLRDARVVLISHHIPARLFPQWYFRLVRSPALYLSGSSGGEEEMLEDFLTTLLKLGVFLSGILQPGSKGPGEDLVSVAPALIVQEEVVLSLTKSEKLLKPEEFLETYNRPIDRSSQSEDVWPASRHLYL